MLLQRTIEQLNLLTHDHISIGGALVSAAAFLLSQKTATNEASKLETDDHPKVFSHHSDADDAVVIVDAGLLQDAKKVKNRLGPALKHVGPVYVIKHSPNTVANREAELEILAAERGKRVVTVSISKGGKDRIRLMSDPAFMAERGPTTLASFESVPFLWHQIHLGGIAMGVGGILLPNSQFFASKYADRMSEQEAVSEGHFVRGTTPESYYEAKRDLKRLFSGLPAATIIREALSEQNVGQIIAVAAPHDRLVDTEASHEWLQSVTGRHIPYNIDLLRPDGDHAGVTDHPGLQVREIEKYLAGDYDPQQLVDTR